MNRFAVSIPALLGTFFLCIFVHAQNCTLYFPSAKGTRLEYKYYGRDSVNVGTTTYTVISKKVSSAGVVIEAEMMNTGFQDKVIFKKKSVVKCKNNMFCMDISQYIAPGWFMEENGAQLNLSNTDMLIPSSPILGQILDSVSIKLSKGKPGGRISHYESRIINRKVEAFEKMTTSAGTFDCIRISYDCVVNSYYTMTYHATDWIAKDVGIVKSEMMAEDNKVKAYSLLRSIRK